MAILVDDGILEVATASVRRGRITWGFSAAQYLVPELFKYAREFIYFLYFRYLVFKNRSSSSNITSRPI